MTLQDIMETGKPLEIRRAIGVSFKLAGVDRKSISDALHVSVAFVDKWYGIYARLGADGLLLQYQGSGSYLTEKEYTEIISHIQEKETITLEYLCDYIEREYGVVYNSKQSYYDLLHKARKSWKKSEKINPGRNEIVVERKREEIKKKLSENAEAIKSGKLVVWMEDECHLRWGDACGYVWGNTNKKTGVEVTNEKEGTTIYGAVNYITRKTVIKEYSTANSENTVDYVKHLRMLSGYENLLLIWDGASYHQYSKMREYLIEINKGLDEKDWRVTCVLFAPYAPDQNPMEDIWLHGKNWIRKHFVENKVFREVKNCFIKRVESANFSFNKLSIFGTI